MAPYVPPSDRVQALQQGGTRARVAAVLLGLTILLVADATPSGLLANLRNWVFDAYERNWPASRPAVRTLVIDIDGKSIRHIGQWPWPRDQLARLVEIAATARVIGIDLLLTEPDRLAGGDRDTDTILAANLHRVPVVLAAAADPAGTSSPHAMPVATPVFEASGDARATCRIIAPSPGRRRRLPTLPPASALLQSPRKPTGSCGECRPWHRSDPC